MLWPMRLGLVFAGLSLKACATQNDTDGRRPTEVVVAPSVASSNGALELRGPPPKLRIVQQPCSPADASDRSRRVAPQAEVGVSASVEARTGKTDDLVPYAAYRCD